MIKLIFDKTIILSHKDQLPNLHIFELQFPELLAMTMLNGKCRELKFIHQESAKVVEHDIDNDYSVSQTYFVGWCNFKTWTRTAEFFRERLVVQTVGQGMAISDDQSDSWLPWDAKNGILCGILGIERRMFVLLAPFVSHHSFHISSQLK